MRPCGPKPRSESTANQPDPDQRSVLPLPDPAFHGEVKEAYTESTPEFPVPVTAPAGAPNVLLVMGDDIGYGHMGAFGGPANTPTFDRLAERGLRFTRHRRLLAAGYLAHLRPPFTFTGTLKKVTVHTESP